MILSATENQSRVQRLSDQRTRFAHERSETLTEIRLSTLANAARGGMNFGLHCFAVSGRAKRLVFLPAYPTRALPESIGFYQALYHLL